jgi:hypothetical protein
LACSVVFYVPFGLRSDPWRAPWGDKAAFRPLRGRSKTYTNFRQKHGQGGLHGSRRRAPQRCHKHAPTPQQTNAAESAARRGDLAGQTPESPLFPKFVIASEPCKVRTPPLNRSKVRLRRLGVQPSPCSNIRATVRALSSRAEAISQAAESKQVQLHKVSAA